MSKERERERDEKKEKKEKREEVITFGRCYSVMQIYITL